MAVVLVGFIVLALAASIINPLHEATDELRHFRFVRYIVQEKGLPVQGETACSAQGHHPPLFYATAALLTGWVENGGDVCHNLPTNPFWAYRYWEVGNDNKNQYIHYTAEEGFPWHGPALAAHLTRMVNILFGAGTVWLTYLIGRAMWEKRPFLAVAGAAFVAFNPMFVYMAGAINNDVVAAFSGAAVTLGCVQLWRDPRGLSWRWGLILGALYSLALMSKFNLAAIALPIGLTMTWVAWRKKQWQLWLQTGLIVVGVTAVLTGWWFVRNQILYGEPTGVERLTELWGVRDPSESFWLAVYELDYAWTSLWGRFGYGQIPLPEVMYDGLLWLTIVAGLGYGLAVMRGETAELKATAFPLFLLLLNVAIFFGVLFNYLLISPAGPMGRFFFPALPSLSILLAYGFSHYAALFVGVGKRPYLADPWLAVILNGGMALMTIIAFGSYLRPAYALPPTFGTETLPNPTHAQFNSLVTLRGYHMHNDTVRPGEAIDLDLYWEVTGQPPGDYLLFVHLLDDNGLMIAQRDTHPGLGNFPTRNWQPGDRFVESVRLVVPETAYTPDMGRLSVGYYVPGAYRLAVQDGEGNSLGDALELGRVSIAPQPGPYPNSLAQNFNNHVRLLGYEYNKRTFAPYDVLAVTLYWEALHAELPDLEVRIGIRDEAGKEVIYHSARPQNGAAPTNSWQAGDVVEDTHLIDLGTSLAPGWYHVEVMLRDTVTEDVQNIVAEDGHLINDHILLPRIEMK
jgi:4-amino-4-deoxy-L-arabinose transferase-like glycosyltransferase